MDFSLIGANIVKLITTYWKVFLIDGVTKTLQFTCIAVVLGAILGTFVAMLKMSKLGIVRFLASVYIEVIRGTPILLQLYFFYLALPEIFSFLDLSKFACVALALSCNSAAYISEIIRSGIQAVDRGQTEAARSLGMSARQAMTRIVMPQAVKNILPSMVNEFASLLKESSLASTFFVGDLMTQYKAVSGATYLPLQPLVLVGIIYFICTFTLSKLVSKLETRLREGD